MIYGMISITVVKIRRYHNAQSKYNLTWGGYLRSSHQVYGTVILGTNAW